MLHEEAPGVIGSPVGKSLIRSGSSLGSCDSGGMTAPSSRVSPCGGRTPHQSPRIPAWRIAPPLSRGARHPEGTSRVGEGPVLGRWFDVRVAQRAREHRTLQLCHVMERSYNPSSFFASWSGTLGSLASSAFGEKQRGKQRGTFCFSQKSRMSPPFFPSPFLSPQAVAGEVLTCGGSKNRCGILTTERHRLTAASKGPTMACTLLARRGGKP
jgi:hypothetical protein